MAEDWFEREVHDLVDLLLQAEIRIVYVSYGFGCDRDSLIQADDIPVATDSLANFIADSEDRGIFRLGENDLTVRSDVGKFEFLLCHEHDIHFSGDETPLLRQVRSRWSKRYEKCYERRSGREWRLISFANLHGERF
jgi:hypothetical protein